MKGYARLWVPLVWYGIACFCMVWIDPSNLGLYFMMGWNVLLAVLPLTAVLGCERAQRAGKTGTVLFLGLLWFLFFPNSVYMPTDMLHLSGEAFYTDNGPYAPVTFARDIVLWLRLMLIAGGIWTSLMLGMESLRRAAALVCGRFGKAAEAAFTVGTVIAAGYGVYIGRFLRLNSWDVLRPIWLMRTVLQGSNRFALLFSAGYGSFVFLCYLIYRLVLSSANKG